MFFCKASVCTEIFIHVLLALQAGFFLFVLTSLNFEYRYICCIILCLPLWLGQERGVDHAVDSAVCGKLET
jgi:hypothetical protein